MISAPDPARLAEAVIAADRAGQIPLAWGRVRALTCLVPAAPQALALRAEILRKGGAHGPAAAVWARAVRLAPAWSDAHYGHSQALLALDRWDAALAALVRVAVMEPGRPEILRARARALYRRGTGAAALPWLNRALRLAPADPETWEVLAMVSRVLARPEPARRAATVARLITPGAVAPLGLAANAALAADQPAAAETLYRRALVLDPREPDAQTNLGLLCLGRGDLAEGWDRLTWRWRVSRPASSRRRLDLPPWDGRPGQRVLVWREQGIGDEMRYAGIHGEAARWCARLVIEADPRLVSLFARSVPEATVVPAPGRTDAPPPPAVEAHLPVACLARLFRRRLSDFPDRRGHLVPDPARVAHWRGRLAELGPGRPVGLAPGSTLHSGPRQAFFPPLSVLAPLAHLADIHWINLQYDLDPAGRNRIVEVLGRPLHEWPDLDLRNDLDDVAALAAALDRVVTAPTSVSDLAASVGTPTLTWLPRGQGQADRLGTDRLPFLPAATLLVVPPGDWSGLGAAMMAWLEGS